MEPLALCWICISKALVLLMLINGAPIISRNVLKACFNSLRTVTGPLSTEPEKRRFAALSVREGGSKSSLMCRRILGQWKSRINRRSANSRLGCVQILINLADCPVDFGFYWTDQRPVFGRSKTWRGLFFALLTGSVSAPLMGFDWEVGLLFAVYSMLGDLLSSFIKRRAGYPESSCFRGVDTIPESLLPGLFLQTDLTLSWLDILLLVLLFSILEALLSPILYWLHIRKRPY